MHADLAKNLQADVYLMFIGMLDSSMIIRDRQAFAQKSSITKTPIFRIIACGSLRLIVIV